MTASIRLVNGEPRWTSGHGPARFLRSEVTDFVVLDDDSDMDAVRDRHIKTNAHAGGLLDEHVERAIAMLVGAA